MELSIGQKYVIVANAHIRAFNRIKKKREAVAHLRSLIKPYEPKTKASA